MKKFVKYGKRLLSVFAAFIVSVFFTSGFFAFANNNDKDFKALAEEMVILVNEAREEAGLKPLYMSPYLCDLAHIRARECIASFSHTRPNGDRFISVLDDSLVPYTRAGENIAAGSGDAEYTFNQWKNSPKHWAAIMNPEYTHIGVAVTYEQNSECKYYWEQFFVATPKKLDNQTIPERYKTVPKSSGDINGDEEINNFDLIPINRYIADDTYFLNNLQLESADVFKDGHITSADAVVLRKYLLGEYKTLPVTMEMLMSGG